MYQKLLIIGYLGRDPELRYTPDGTPVCNFSVATSNKWTGSDGTQHDETTWFRVSAWRRMAEVCAQYLKKGRLVMVEGRLKPDDNGNPRTFTRNDGSAGASFEIQAQTVKFLGGRGEQSDGAPVDEGFEPDAPGEEIPF